MSRGWAVVAQRTDEGELDRGGAFGLPCSHSARVEALVLFLSSVEAFVTRRLLLA